MGEAYPRRSSHFAHRFVRLMARTCAGNRIGPDACWLLTVIAMTEDAKRYTGAVSFYAANLADQCGFSRSSMERARDRAAAGWLHYAPGTKGRAATYWVTVPPEEEGKPDGPSDEDSVQMLRQLDVQSEPQAGSIRAQSDVESEPHVTHSLTYTCPLPFPEEEAARSGPSPTLFGDEKTEKPKRGKKPKPDGSSVPLPPALDAAAFRDAWADWLADRKARGKPVTEIAARQQLGGLEPLGPANAILCVRESISKAWTGLFPQKYLTHPPNDPGYAPPPGTAFVPRIAPPMFDRTAAPAKPSTVPEPHAEGSKF